MRGAWKDKAAEHRLWPRLLRSWSLPAGAHGPRGVQSPPAPGEVKGVCDPVARPGTVHRCHIAKNKGLRVHLSSPAPRPAPAPAATQGPRSSEKAGHLRGEETAGARGTGAGSPQDPPEPHISELPPAEQSAYLRQELPTPGPAGCSPARPGSRGHAAGTSRAMWPAAAERALRSLPGRRAHFRERRGLASGAPGPLLRALASPPAPLQGLLALLCPPEARPAGPQVPSRVPRA